MQNQWQILKEHPEKPSIRDLKKNKLPPFSIKIVHLNLRSTQIYRFAHYGFKYD